MLFISKLLITCGLWSGAPFHRPAANGQSGSKGGWISGSLGKCAKYKKMSWLRFRALVLASDFAWKNLLTKGLLSFL